MSRSRSFKTVPIVLDLSSPMDIDGSEAEKVLSVLDLLPPTPESPRAVVPEGKTLRRKKHLSIAQPPNAKHTRSHSQPTPAVQLGHPSRPHYTAIRPRPTSMIIMPPSSPPPSSDRPASIDVKQFNRRSTFLDVQIPQDVDADDIALPTPSCLSPPSLSTSGTTSSGGYSHVPFGLGFTPPGIQLGHSTSGETEMKMALASKATSEKAASEHSQSSKEPHYRFAAPNRKSPTKGSLKGQLTRLSRSMKGFFRH